MSDARRVGRLHVLTVEPGRPGRGHLELARMAAQGGADVVQFREKRWRSTAELVRIGRQLRDVLGPRGVRLIINDRVDVALAVGADGVHLGQHDLEPAVARAMLGPAALIGATANSLEQAVRIASEPIDYLGVGPVLGTRSKPNPAAELGLDGLRGIVAAVDKPVIAIGNLRPEVVAEVLGAGAHGIATLSAVADDPDPTRATRRFREAVDACLVRIG